MTGTLVFEEAVTIAAGVGVPSKIRGVTEAYTFLDTFPISKRDEAHRMAMLACKAAFTGDVDAETVRGTFEAFAKRRHLLLPDLPAHVLDKKFEKRSRKPIG